MIWSTRVRKSHEEKANRVGFGVRLAIKTMDASHSLVGSLVPQDGTALLDALGRLGADFVARCPNPL